MNDTEIMVNGRAVDLRNWWLLKLMVTRKAAYAQRNAMLNMGWGSTNQYFINVLENAIQDKIELECRHIVNA